MNWNTAMGLGRDIEKIRTRLLFTFLVLDKPRPETALKFVNHTGESLRVQTMGQLRPRLQEG